MITLHLLEDDDIIQANDWCRPMSIQPVNHWSDDINFTNTYSGEPTNNVKWLTAAQYCPYWIGKKLKEYNDNMESTGTWFEFVRGQLPIKHQYGKTRRELLKDYDEYLRCNVMQFGKYKETTFFEIKYKDKQYFHWAVNKGLIDAMD